MATSVLGRKSLLIFLNNVLAAGAGMVGLLLIGRYMGAQAYGMFGVALSLALLMGHLSRFGLDRAHEKKVSEGQDLGACITTYGVLRGGLALVTAVLLVIGAWAWHRTQGFFDATSLAAVLLMSLYLLLEQVRIMAQSTFNGLRETAKAQVGVFVENLVRLPLLAVAVLLFGAAVGHPVPFRTFAIQVAQRVGLAGPLDAATGAELLALAYVTAMGAAAAAALWLMRRHRYPMGRFRPGLAKQYLRFAAPIAMVTVLGAVSLQVDKILLGFFWNSTVAGQYFAAQRIATLALVIPGAVGTVFFPLMSELASSGRMQGLRMVAGSTQRMLGLVMAVAAAGVLVFAPEGVRLLLGSDFGGSVTPLRILMIHTVLTGLFTVPSSIVLGSGNSRGLALVGTVIAGGNILLNLVLIPDSLLGIPMLGLRAEGAAWASGISFAAGFMLMLGLCRRQVGFVPMPRVLLKHAFAAAVAALLGMALKPLPLFGGLQRFYALAVAVLLVLLAYVLVLWLLGELRRKDLVWAADVLHPGRMVGYIREELRSGGPSRPEAGAGDGRDDGTPEDPDGATEDPDGAGR